MTLAQVLPNPSTQNADCRFIIRDVWSDNLHEEMQIIRDVVEKYPYISMDTEFPGVVARPIGNFKTSADYHYQTLRCNVDLLKIIQLGITFSDEHGNLPRDVCTWQFNFRFSLDEDMYAQDSIDLLAKSGIDFKRHYERGIDVLEFGEVMMSSGMVLLDDVKWISFHSGYDFGYLLKLLTCLPLPADETHFFRSLHLFFPCLYDIKYLMKSCKNLKGGLQDVADDLKVQRVGPQHQAGSDSLLTALTFFQLRHTFFDDKIDDSLFLGHLYGLGTPAVLKQQTESYDPMNAQQNSTTNSSGAGTTKQKLEATATANQAANSLIATLRS